MTADDGVDRARLWREAGRYFADLDPEAAREPDEEGLVEWLDDIRERGAADPAVLMLVAEVDGEVVGEVAARLHEPLPSARWQLQRDLGRRRVHVGVLAVADDARRAGVGTALMAAVERWAADRGAAVITLETGLSNPTSVPFYERRMGYARQEVIFRKVLP
ncbi:GNAT family N-acetyltransferase [Dactylosporangium sp. NPDC051541]|uniref:GNAT family N-acetyltransferase n=1 Tax=Dactylosporangium sp. NPDC051541 TaxID=3363977 RepID=UPI003795A6DE